jgi:hypothetical protein
LNIELDGLNNVSHAHEIAHFKSFEL